MKPLTLARIFDRLLILIVIAVITFLLFSCKESSDTNPDASSDTGTTPPPTVTPPPVTPPIVISPPVVTPPVITPPVVIPPITDEPTDSTITLSLLTENGTLYFYDGTDFIFQNNIAPVNCGLKCFTDGPTLNIYNDQGQIQNTTDLIITPAFIIDNTIIENILPSVAADMGGQAKNYVQIYQGGVALAVDNAWYYNQYTASDFIKTDSGAYIIIDSTGGYHSIDGTTGINHAKDLLIYDFDNANKLVQIADSSGDYPVTWSSNYFGNAKHWQYLSGSSGGAGGSSGDTDNTNGKWISNNGYEYLDGVLSENANEMWIWNAGPYPVALPGIEKPVVISAGTAQDTSYWIEANTGWLFSYTDDQIQMISRIYQGDGYRLTGIANSKTLTPVIIGQDLYFNYDGSVWKLDISTGIIEIFYAGRAVIREW